MKTKLFLITPPFAQLNTPCPATAYIKVFLNTKKIESVQADLGIDVILKLFSKEGLENLFQVSSLKFEEISDNSKRIFALQDEYLKTINPIIAFLQGKNPTLFKFVKKISCKKRQDLHSWKNLIGLLGTFLSELYPIEGRYSGASFTFNFAGIMGAAFASLIAKNHVIAYVSFYLSAATVQTFISLFGD